MDIKNIFLVIILLFLEGCSKLHIKTVTSSSCNREVAPYSLDALERDYSCQEKKEEL